MDTKSSAVRARQELEPRATSISAHTVLMVSVTMSTTEMDTLVQVLEHVPPIEMGSVQASVVREFCQAIASIR